MPSSSSRRPFTAGLFESSGVRERSSCVEERPGPHPLGDREGEVEIALLRVLQKAAGEPVIVGCPGRELLGASLRIVLKTSERFDRADRGKRVFDRLRRGRVSQLSRMRRCAL